MLETAHRYYGDDSVGELRRQWKAWERYACTWAGREDYRKIWRAIRPQFHDDFVAYMDRMVSQQSRVVRT